MINTKAITFIYCAMMLENELFKCPLLIACQLLEHGLSNLLILSITLNNGLTQDFL